MKRLKNFSAIFLALLLIISTIPISAGAEGPAFIAGGDCGSGSNDYVEWALYDDGTLEITGRGNMYSSYDPNRAPWFEKGYADKIKTVKIGNNVTSIGRHVFRNCKNLESVQFGTRIGFIGEYAFSGCESLKNADIRYGVSTIQSNAFSDCTSLTNVTLPSTLNIIDDYVFKNCKSLTSVTLPDRTASIGKEAFYGCESLTDINIPANVSTIELNAFDLCKSLKNIIVSEDNDNYSDIDGILFNKAKTTLYVCPDGKTGKLSIPNSAKDISNKAFSNCSGLTEIEIPDSVTTIGYLAFIDCNSLVSVNISESVISIALDAFSKCSALKNITVAQDNKDYCDIDGVLFNKAKDTLLICPEGKTGAYVVPESTKEIVYNAFSNCGKLTDVKITDNVTTIGDYAFNGCTALTNVKLSNSLKEVSYTTFSGCISLESINIPKSVTNIVIGSDRRDCIGLKNIIVAQGNTNYSDIDGVLFNKNKDTLILCPDGRTGEYVVPESTKEIANNAFRNCDKLTGVKITDNITKIEDYTFYNCGSLQNVQISDSVTTLGRMAFSGCYNLGDIVIRKNIITIDYAFYNSQIKNLVIADGVEEISDYAFEYCRIENIDLGSIKKIGERAFYMCTSIQEKLYIPNSVETIGRDAFGNGRIKELIIGDGTAAEKPLKIDGAFYQCGIDNLKIGRNLEWSDTSYSPFSAGYYTESVTFLDGMKKVSANLFNHHSIGKLTLSDSVEVIEENAFYWAYLTDVNLGNGLKTIGDNAFYICSFTEITLPESITSIGEGVFSMCNSLTDITIGGSGTIAGNETVTFKEYGLCNNGIKNLTIGKNISVDGEGKLFSNVGQLQKLTVLDSVTEIPSELFNNCSKLADITLGNDLEVIGDRAFNTCPIRSITIPASVKKIGKNVFTDCRMLGEIKVDKNSKSYCDIDGVLYNADKTKVIQYPYCKLGEVNGSVGPALEYVIPDGVTVIEEGAFSTMFLWDLAIPESTTSISENEFANRNSLFKINCYNGSYADTYAKQHNIPVKYRDVFVFKLGSEKAYYSNADMTLPIGASCKMYNGRTYVPFRAAASAAGINDLKFDSETNSVTFTGANGYTIKMTIGSTECAASYNGGDPTILTINAPVIIDGATYLPIRDIAALTGGGLKYKGDYVLISQANISDDVVDSYINDYIANVK